MVFTARSEAQLSEMLKLCKELSVPVTILGNGSNVVAPDEGLRGAVITPAVDIVEIKLDAAESIICGAGIKLSALAVFAANNALTGLEFAHGIPGTAGGGAYMNAGAYGGEMKDVLLSCRHVDQNGDAGEISGDGLCLSYRSSVYKQNGAFITGLKLKLAPGDPVAIIEKMRELGQRRREKQPLEYPSAGSVFKRPPGNFAGTLIEQCGLKGYRIGGAEVSEKHAGFIINAGGATAADILKLIDHIKNVVMRETGITLECELKIL